MSAVADLAHAELVEDAPFFAPVSSDLIDTLLAQHDAMKASIERVAATLEGEEVAIRHFLEGNTDRQSRGASLRVEALFKTTGAMASLSASFWSRALAMTDVYECMPKARRDEWDASIREMTTPAFAEDAVRPTLLGLLIARDTFFAERVDGIFRGLSGDHVTNAPEAFGKRMILSGMASDYGHYSYERAGLINDFRAVVGKFMGRGEPGWGSTKTLIEQARRQHGEWLSCDGGSWRLRVYLKGTAHLDVHPDMAWRLNCVLASLYPLAIPAEFRAKPKKRAKEFQMIGRPLPFAVIDVLATTYQVHRDKPTVFQFSYAKRSAAVEAEAVSVLEAIGAVKEGDRFRFDYVPVGALSEIVSSGCIPDRASHQFYATPESIGRVCVEMAQIGEAHTVLEPSAGHGGLAMLLPQQRTTCVEISTLHCAILQARGFSTVHADFLVWAEKSMREGVTFDRVVMNPPFSDGRAMTHVRVAAQLVRPGGRLVAVLPASMRGKALLDGFAHDWSRVMDNEFAGTSVSVSILAAERQS